ncbi:MAG: ATP-binding protein [Candidatus Methanomethylicus sp.]|nr:ATP-binding protein [Candidatus Methanomethylicus sp.]
MAGRRAQQSYEELEEKCQSLENELKETKDNFQELKETIDAIVNGTVDSIVRHTPRGNQIYMLKGSEEPYRNLIEDMEEGAVILSSVGTILYCNKGFSKLIDTPIDKIMGNNIAIWISEGSASTFAQLISSIKADLIKEKFQMAFQTTNKRTIPTQVSVYKITFGSVSASALIITDLTKHMEEEVKLYTANLEREVTERKKTEEALKASEKFARLKMEELEVLHKKLEEKAIEVEEYASRMEQLAQERLNKLKAAERFATIGTTAGMVGHDIRNPLQAIVSEIDLAKFELLKIPDGKARANIIDSLSSIEKNIDYINKIVLDLQDYARPLKPVMQEVDLEFLCNEVISKSSKPQNIEVLCQISDDLKIITDEVFLRRILNNLVKNSIQAMPEGGRLTIRAYPKGKGVGIEIDDTGTGIAPEAQLKIFMPLFTTKSKGQGFGLAVVKRMTEALNGTVTFESQVGKGTKFIVYLPPN